MTDYNILGVNMFDNLFENRNRTVSQLIKLGDYLGRSLRENLSIFKIDVETKNVCYVSESDKVIVGTYDLDDTIAITNIIVEDLDSFASEEKFESLVNFKLSNFVKNIYEDSHKDARESFDDLLYLWESRLKFKNIKTRLEEKSLRFDESSNIINTKQFDNLLEVAPTLVNYLKENKSKISKISEIKSAVRLSQTISEAFDMPRMDYETLKEEGSFVIKPTADSSIYEMICRHELIKKELLEHKANFDTVWASNEKVQNLAGLIYSEVDTVSLALIEATKEVPYLCLASKKQLTETFKNALSLNKVKSVGVPEIQKYASVIFEMKKPLKVELINHLNERYGVNVQNLKDPATFKSLLNTQIAIFETLAKISPKKSVLRDVLFEMSNTLSTKNGVEAIDVNELIQEIFIAAGYDDIVLDESLNNYLDFEKIAGDLDRVGGILRMIKGAAPEQGMPKPMGTPQAPMPTGVDDDDVQSPLTPEDSEESMNTPEEEGEMPEEEIGGEEELDPMPAEPSEEEVLVKMKELEDLISSLKMQIGGGEEDTGEEDDMDGPEDENEIDDEQEELDDEEDEIEAEHEEAHEDENEAEEKEDIVRNKKKKLEKKEDSLKRMK